MNTSEMKESTGRLRQESSCPKGRVLTPGTPGGNVLKTDQVPRAARARALAAHAQQPPQRLLPDALHRQEDRGPPEPPDASKYYLQGTAGTTGQTMEMQHGERYEKGKPPFQKKK